MRGPDERSDFLFSYVSPEQRVPAGHPLRPIRRIVDAALGRLSKRFEALYTDFGRPSIPPEQLLRALLLQVFYTVRSERLLIEQLEYNMLFRWFVGLGLDEPIWDHSTFSKNRDRLLRGDVAAAFFAEVLAEARAHGLLSDEHFTVDGTLLEAWASHKSFRPKDEDPPAPPDDPKNPTVNFRGERRKNDTHQSTTDPDARMYRKSDGHPARLVYMGESLGGAVALRLALEEAPLACVLQSTFTSLREVARQHYPAALSALAGDAYPNLERIGRLRAPVLILHGEVDEIVPVGHAEALFEAAREPRRLHVVPGAGHNDLVQAMGPSYGTEVAGWLR